MIKKERIEFTKAARKGFTLIEILIVVAIIAILASVVLVGLGPTQQAGRDARRLADLEQVQNGLELYYNKCGYYPGAAAAAACAAAWSANNTWAGMTAALKGSTLGIAAVPNDPSTGKNYGYGSTNGTSYIVAATMENVNGSEFRTYTPVAPLQTGVASCAAPVYCKTL